MRLLVYSNEDLSKSGRLIFIGHLFEALPSQFYHDEHDEDEDDDENDEWHDHVDGVLRNGCLTTMEVDYLHKMIGDAIRAARFVRQTRFSDAETYLLPLLEVACTYGVHGCIGDADRSPNSFLEMMNAVPW